MTKTEQLTARQEEILRLISRGKTDKEIASLLRIKEGTVGSHITIIFARLRVQSRAQAIFRWFGR
jgi:DNA-binding CsgD family transcriptional regulator